ncbi:lipid-A-disaccharide synthase [Methylotenera sp. N17]|uniref:lipid-A-disaccharide synthase n=1 Tax=Methylotenera sp. N17 TaxID=1502761 RepID=UPI0006463B8B|nr:lipid-A-disaccharide synthase [Methylotenera sp. N17]
MSKTAPKVAIVAGEASGDLLGFHLIQALQSERSDIAFLGIAGPKMISLGAQSLFPMEKLSVRGYVEVIRHLYGLLKLRKQLLKQLLEAKPDVFVGIDAPDFNFWLERKLKAKGIPTIHYVSPSIWAWRKGRIHKIKRAVSHMLALFPFEAPIYEQVNIPVTYVGHPLADVLPMEPDVDKVRETLKIHANTIVVAMLPGSRQSEVTQHAQLFVDTAQIIQHEYADTTQVVFLVPLITRETREIFERAIHAAYLLQPEMVLNMQIMFGHAHDAMEAADVVIVASGTATLEAALLKKPMVITYKMPFLSWQILKRMQYLPYVGLPNILAGKFLVPELLQHEATPQNVADATLRLLSDKTYLQTLKDAFSHIHQGLKQNSAKKAAQTVLSYL